MFQLVTLLGFDLQGVSPSRKLEPSRTPSSPAVHGSRRTSHRTSSAPEASPSWTAAFNARGLRPNENTCPPGLLPSRVLPLSVAGPVSRAYPLLGFAREFRENSTRSLQSLHERRTQPFPCGRRPFWGSPPRHRSGASRFHSSVSVPSLACSRCFPAVPTELSPRGFPRMIRNARPELGLRAYRQPGKPAEHLGILSCL